MSTPTLPDRSGHFGEFGGKLTGLVLAELLISTVSAMTLAVLRVLQVIGEGTPPAEVSARFTAATAD